MPKPKTTSSTLPFPKFTKAQLEEARAKTVPDTIRPNLTVLFAGINPGLYTAATGWHFGRPGNRFYPALAASGFTPRLIHPSEKQVMLDLGFGISNLVYRPSARADELSITELQQGAKQLAKTVEKYKPKVLAILGVTAYRQAFNLPKAELGLQPERIGSTHLYILPNPSGLNAHYQGAALAALFKQLHAYAYNLK